MRISVDESIDAEQVFVPSMCIHLLVENAVKHGFRGMPAPHHLTIDCQRNTANGQYKDILTITVENDGIPFDSSKHQMGNGLHILRSIISMYNYRIRGGCDFDIQPQNQGQGTIARLSFDNRLLAPDDIH